MRENSKDRALILTIGNVTQILAEIFAESEEIKLNSETNRTEDAISESARFTQVNFVQVYRPSPHPPPQDVRYYNPPNTKFQLSLKEGRSSAARIHLIND